jgi:hypothetical protein
LTKDLPFPRKIRVFLVNPGIHYIYNGACQAIPFVQSLQSDHNSVKMSAITDTSSPLWHIRYNLEAFDVNLRGIREWCTRLGDHSDLVEMKNKLKAPSKLWDTCYLKFREDAMESDPASSVAKLKQTECLLRAAYSLFAQLECAEGVYSVHDAASILLEVLNDSKLQPTRGDGARFVARRGGMREHLEVVRVQWEILLQDLKIVSLSGRPGNSVLRLFEDEKTLDQTFRGDGTVTVLKSGSEYSITYVEQSSDGCSECEVWAREREMRFDYPWDTDTKTVKRGAKALCWSKTPLPSNVAPGQELVTVWNEPDGSQFSAAQTFC